MRQPHLPNHHPLFFQGISDPICETLDGLPADVRPYGRAALYVCATERTAKSAKDQEQSAKRVP